MIGRHVVTRDPTRPPHCVVRKCELNMVKLFSRLRIKHLWTTYRYSLFIQILLSQMAATPPLPPPPPPRDDPPEIAADSGPALSVGELRLFSFYAPSILSGPTYQIQAAQTLTASLAITIPAPSPQKFTIFAPHAKLEPGDIHSVFPAPGHSALSRTLPHVVFTNPYIPWERGASSASKSRIPWLAVIAFDPAELCLTAAQLGIGGLFAQTAALQQSATMAVRISAGAAAAGSKSVTLPFPTPSVDTQDGIAVDTMLDMVFVDAKLAYALLGAEDTPFQKYPDLNKYQYLAHAREVSDGGGGRPIGGIYSVVLSHRTGPWDITAPATVVVHLVGLAGIPSIELTDPTSAAAQLADTKLGLISLHSWSYTCVPSGGPDIVAAMTTLGAQSEQLFRAPTISVCPPGAIPVVFAAMNARLDAGYVLLRHRLPTGEPTVAFYRSPLTPLPVPQIPPPAWPAQSNFGTDYQILDRSMGVMDISYSAAFQLGKALAIADAPFHACLARVRGALYESAHGAAAKEVYRANDRYWDVADVVGPDAMNEMGHCQEQLRRGPAVGDIKWARRWAKVRLDDEETKQEMEGKVKAQLVGSHLAKEMEKLAGTKPPAPPPPPPETPAVPSQIALPTITQRHPPSEPYSTDWATIVKWLMDCLLLSNIPAHYLIPDPSFLPPESLRFFHIDPIWLDCMIDGALSLANHLDGVDDLIRQAIKSAFNRHLSTPLHPGTALRPQTARCGFFIRSRVIAAYTDMQVRATWPSNVNRPAEALDVVWCGRLDTDLLCCLLDRLPDDLALACISITPPPHQQSFTLGDSFGVLPPVVSLQVKKLPAPDPTTGAWDAFPALTWGAADSQVYDWDTRSIRVKALCGAVAEKLSSLPGYGTEWDLGSAVMGLLLNDDVHSLDIVNQKAAEGGEWVQDIRRLSVGPPEETAPDVDLRVGRRGAGGTCYI